MTRTRALMRRLCMLTLLLALAGSTACIRQVAVNRHRSISFTATNANAILNGMSQILGQDSGGVDFACAGEFADVLAANPLNTLPASIRQSIETEIARHGVTPTTRPVPLLFLLLGSVGNTTGVADIMTEAQFNTVDNGPGFVKVVNGIFYCAGPRMTSATGCTGVGGFDSMVVKNRSNDNDAAHTWAHEFGHAVGLSHTDDSEPERVMYRFSSSTKDKIDLLECVSFTELIDSDGPGGQPRPSPEQPEAELPRPPGMSLEEWVRQTPEHGLPFSTKDQLRASDVPQLLRMLARPSEAEHRDKILAMLGMVGDARVGSLIAAHIERMRQRGLSWSSMNELTSAMLGLGVLAHQQGDLASARRLRDFADPTSWRLADKSLGRSVQQSAMMGMALSGLPWSQDQLSRMAEGSSDPEMATYAEDVQEIAARVASEGLEAVMSGRR